MCICLFVCPVVCSLASSTTPSFQGISWHIMVIESLVPKNEDYEVKSDVFISLMDQKAKQDAKTVGCIMKEVLKMYTANNPSIEDIYLRSDQAGENIYEHF